MVPCYSLPNSNPTSSIWLDRDGMKDGIPYTWCMFVVLRTALFWLAMLAVPLQGFAAAGPMPMRMSAHDAVPMQAQSVQASSVQPMVEDTASSDCVDLAIDCSHGSHMPGMAKCALSAGCALVAAPIPQSHVLVQSPSSTVAFPALVSADIAFLTGAPERPPRFLS